MFPKAFPKFNGYNAGTERRAKMRRRDFVAGLTAYTAVLGATHAQALIRRVGVLITGSFSTQNIFDMAMRELGWHPGQDVQIDYRLTNGDEDSSRADARELISLNPNVLFAVTNTSMAALYVEETNIPTVFAMVSDPVGMHYVDSFAKPGRNITGFTGFEPSLGSKWVSVLKEIAPNVEHIGLVYDPEPGNNSSSFRKAIDEDVNNLHILSIETPVGDSSDIERLIVSVSQKSNGGLIFLPDAFTFARRDQIVPLVNRCRLPAIYPLRSYCAAGGLLSYGVDIKKVVRGAASYVDRILRGTHPADLPVQAPTEFELVINQPSAKELGLQVPAMLLARADEVIE
jgi:putative ABC transport system substrate-binding protein